MASDLDLLECGEILEGVFLELGQLGSQLPKLTGDVDPLLLGHLQEPLDLVLDLDHVPLELQVGYARQKSGSFDVGPLPQPAREYSAPVKRSL